LTTLPTQTGNTGKYLTTDGSTASWDNPLPSQATNAGKFLTTNGSVAAWQAVPSAFFLVQLEASM